MSADFSSQEKLQCWENSFHLDSVHCSFSYFCIFPSDSECSRIIEFVLSVMMFFVYETGKILHTPGTAFLFNNPIYTEIELNKTGTYFFHQKKVGFFPPCFL